ncbi:MAG: indole-3-glycerol phosphate synthase TrpC [Firmicutes bacterium]|nr:indole-3-glycerol phosphate synthase TrpC [Bacillota bacterium]
MFLERIVAHKREEVARLQTCFPVKELKKRAADAPPTRDFYQAIQRDGPQVNLIAEIKKASPSRGVIRADFCPREIARTYDLAGAKAISVLTEEKFFLGHPKYLQQVKAVTPLPLLRKDFIIVPYQVYESRVLGADAILLIAAILEQSQLEECLGLAGELGLAVLVEVHTAAELTRVLATGAEIIGINNRNLDDFQTDLATTFSLAPSVPAGKVVVSESGIRTAAEIGWLAASGVHAVLVGETLMQAADIGQAVKRLIGGQSRG